MALSAVLVSPEFLFRVEQDPPASRRTRPTASATSSSRRACRSSSGAASRTTSCSTWPTRGELQQARGARAAGAPDAGRPAVASLVTNFAGQWLHLRNLESITPDLRAVPRLRRQPAAGLPAARPSCSSRASCARTAACSTCCEPDHTFLNERLAKHYGIPARLRQPLPPRRRSATDSDARRPAAPGEHPDRHVVRDPHVARDPRQVDPGEHPRHAAAAAARRTCRRSKDNTVVGDALGPRAAGRAPRERRLRGLPQADGPGRLRARELTTRSAAGGPPRRASRSTPPAACPTAASSTAWPASKQALLSRPELFVGTLTEKLLTFALGRGVEYYDAPGGPQDRPRGPGAGLPLLVADRGDRQQHAVPDEEIRNDRHEEGPAAADVPARAGDDAGAAAAGRDGPVDDRAGRDAGRQPGCAAWASSTCRWAATCPLDARRARTRSTSCRRSSARWRR